MRRTFTKVVAFLTTVTISFSILFTTVLAQEEVEEVYEDEQMQEEITNEEEASEQEVERSNQLEIELQQREESLREAEILKNQAEEQIAKGSVGFFEYVQDSVAISRINNATIILISAMNKMPLR